MQNPYLRALANEALLPQHWPNIKISMEDWVSMAEHSCFANALTNSLDLTYQLAWFDTTTTLGFTCNIFEHDSPKMSSPYPFLSAPQLH